MRCAKPVCVRRCTATATCSGHCIQKVDEAKAHCTARGGPHGTDANASLNHRVETAQGEASMATAPRATRPPLPPFTRECAKHKVRLAEDGWNTRDPGTVALAYAINARWRNRSEFINGRNAIMAFLARKWAKELDYWLIKELWACTGNRIAVRFAYEWHDDSGH